MCLQCHPNEDEPGFSSSYHIELMYIACKSLHTLGRVLWCKNIQQVYLFANSWPGNIFMLDPSDYKGISCTLQACFRSDFLVGSDLGSGLVTQNRWSSFGQAVPLLICMYALGHWHPERWHSFSSPSYTGWWWFMWLRFWAIDQTIVGSSPSTTIGPLSKTLNSLFIMADSEPNLQG